MTRIWCRILPIFATLAVAVAVCGCEGEPELGPTGVSGGSGPSLRPDLGYVDAGGDAGPNDQPLRSYCRPGERRCLFENSPLFEQCDLDGERFEVDACAAGEMCRTGRCVDFACAPGKELCVGTQTRATCAEDGRSVRDAARCEGAGDVCRGGECIDACAAAEREQSYIGCEYIARELPNAYRYGGESDEESPFAIVVANPDRLLDAEITITDPDGTPSKLLEQVDVTSSDRLPNQSYRVTVRSEILSRSGTSRSSTTQIESPAASVSVPPQAAAVFLMDPGMPKRMRSYRVESTRPIIAYQFSPYCCNFTYTNDASLLLPTTTLGERYRVLGFPSLVVENSTSISNGTMTVVAHEDGTEVDIDSPIDLRFSDDWFPNSHWSDDLVRLDAGESITFGTASTAGDREVNRDLSGTVVEANKRIAVFAGHECTFVPQDEWACDHLEEQMLPAQTLGKRYLLTPTRRRGYKRGQTIGHEAVYWRLVADEDSTITFEPPLESLTLASRSNDATPSCRAKLEDGRVQLAAGEVCEFGTMKAVAVESTGTLMVGGIISGHQSTGMLSYGSHAGDPSFFVVPPVEQFRTGYSFVSPPTFARNYVAVAVPQGGAVALDGVALAPEARLGLRQVDLGGKTWDIFNVAIEAGYHTMESSERFGIVVYAFDDYVSYAFPGGLDLLPKGSR